MLSRARRRLFAALACGVAAGAVALVAATSGSGTSIATKAAESPKVSTALRASGDPGVTGEDFHAAALPEGKNALSVDHTPPALTLSGTLKSAEGQTLTQPSYGLTVNAADGTAISASSERSGVKSVEILVDGQRQDYAEQQCPGGSCSLNRTWTLHPSDYADGRHTVTIKATDYLDHLTQQSFQISTDANGPDLSVSGPLVDTSDALVGADPELTVDATDRGSGVTSVELLVDGQQADVLAQDCPDWGCELQGTLGPDLSGDDPGSHTYEIVATDGVGNATTESGTFRLDPTPPLLAVSGALADADGQPLPADTADAQIEAFDDAAGDSGIAKIEISVDDNTDTTDNLDCNPSCPGDATTAYTYDKARWGDGEHVVTISATDLAGNVTRHSLDVDSPTPPPATCPQVSPTVQDPGPSLQAGQSSPPDPFSITGALVPGTVASVAAGGFGVDHGVCLMPTQTTATVADDQRKVNPPDKVNAYPLLAVTRANLKAAAEQDACDFAQNQHQPGHNLMILAFRRAHKKNDEFGVGADRPDSPFFSNHLAIRAVLKAAADGYKACQRPHRTVTIVYANTNYKISESGDDGRPMSTDTARMAGYEQFALAFDLNKNPPAGVNYSAVAGDIEPGFDPLGDDQARSLAQGASSQRLDYYDFGDAGQCPPIGQCQAAWSRADLGAISQANRSHSLPEIYHPEQAQQWAGVRKVWDNSPACADAPRPRPPRRHRHCYGFYGAMSEPMVCPGGSDFTPRESWINLRDANPNNTVLGHVVYYNPDCLH